MLAVSYQSLVYSVSIMAGHSVRIFVMPTAQIFFSTCPETFCTSGITIFSTTMPNILSRQKTTETIRKRKHIKITQHMHCFQRRFGGNISSIRQSVILTHTFRE